MKGPRLRRNQVFCEGGSTAQIGQDHESIGEAAEVWAGRYREEAAAARSKAVGRELSFPYDIDARRSDDFDHQGNEPMALAGSDAQLCLNCMVDELMTGRHRDLPSVV
jgi:hypothetical protein